MPPKRAQPKPADTPDSDDDRGEHEGVEGSATVADDAVVFAADFTYPFLKGVQTVGNARPRKVAIPRSALDRMTGMERQFWEIKMRFFDVAVFFKKGKFYELYDCDAVIGNREFGLKMAQDLNNRGKMRMSGVPEQSFAEWSRLFVFKGYKVGKVEQIAVDDAMIAANGGKPPACIPRELVSIITRGTVTDSSMLPGNDSNYVLTVAPPAAGSKDVVDAVALDVSRRVFWHCPCADIDEFAALVYQLSPTEVVISADMPSGETATAALPSAVTSADVFRIARAVNPDCALEELATLPVPKRPAAQETPAVDTIAPADGVTSFSSPARDAAGDYLRYLMQDVAQLLPALKATNPVPTAFCTYAAHRHGAVASVSLSAAELLEQQRSKPILSLERDDDSGLAMDAAAIESLELTANLRDGDKTGTLLNYFSGSGRNAATPGGQRMLRQWVLRPSSNLAVISARQQLVAMLAGCAADRVASGDALNAGDIGADMTLADTWFRGLGTTPVRGAADGGTQPSPASPPLPSSGGRGGKAVKLASLDLERLLGRVSDIANTDTRVSFADPLVMYPKQLKAIDDTLQGFVAVGDTANHIAEWAAGLPDAAKGTPGVRLLLELVEPCRAVLEPISAILQSSFDRTRIFGRDDGFVLPRSREQCPEYFDAVDTLKSTRAALDAKLGEFKKKLGAGVGYADLGKDLFLLEIPTKLATPAAIKSAGIPATEFKERARTAKAVKMQVASMAGVVADYKAALTAKELALVAVLCGIARDLCRSWPLLFAASSAVAYLDCLAALAACAQQQASMGAVCVPNFVAEEAGAADACGTAIAGDDVFHPIVLLQSGRSVPNSFALDSASGRVLVLTGPNMAGKSTLMRTLAVAIISAQLGGFVCGKSFAVRGSPVDRIFTRIGARDATHRGLSTLHVELSEMAVIHRAATARSLCLVDELGRGTSTHDGYAIAHASLAGLCGAAETRRPLGVFSTHYHGLALDVQYRMEHQDAYPGQAPVQVGYMDFRAGPEADVGSKRHREADEGNGPAEDEAASPVSAVDRGVTFLYRLVKGVCARSYGVEVAARAGVAPHILAKARAMSGALQATATDLQLVAFAKDVVANRTHAAAARAAQLRAMTGAHK